MFRGRFLALFLLGFIYCGKCVKSDNDIFANLMKDLFSGMSKPLEHELSNERECDLLSSTKENLDSSEDLLHLLQKFIQSSKIHLRALKRSTCTGRKVGQASSRLVSNKVGTTNNTDSPTNCQEIKKSRPSAKSGIYQIWPKYINHPINVFCDMNTTTGGWTVIQRRTDVQGNNRSFFRNWNDYKRGFGDLEGEFWIGNDVIFALSNENPSVLRVELEDFEGTKRYATYTHFEVSSELNKYVLKVGGYYGDAGDSLSFQNGQHFYTFDRPGIHDCPNKYKGAWWYAHCHMTNLNGLYLRGNHSSYADGVNWKTFRGFNYSLKKVEMKVRPLMF